MNLNKKSCHIILGEWVACRALIGNILISLIKLWQTYCFLEEWQSGRLRLFRKQMY